MAKTILTSIFVVFLYALVGCDGIDSGKSQFVLAGSQPKIQAVTSDAGEADIVEMVVYNRLAYQQGLEALVELYTQTGEATKVNWVKKELAGLKAMVRYNYIIEATIAGPELRATESIVEADYMYDEARRIEKKARGLVIINNEDQLRLALLKYNQLITKHPTSDKIDDAAFRSAKICQDFLDTSVAILYYKRACQWDPDSEYPACFKAAYLLDRGKTRLDEALTLYQQAAKKENLQENYKEFAKERIAELTKTPTTGE